MRILTDDLKSSVSIHTIYITFISHVSGWARASILFNMGFEVPSANIERICFKLCLKLKYGYMYLYVIYASSAYCLYSHSPVLTAASLPIYSIELAGGIGTTSTAWPKASFSSSLFGITLTSYWFDLQPRS